MTFTFLAKQGQSQKIAQLLANLVGKPRIKPYDGPRGQGIMIEPDLPRGTRKRSIDSVLHRNQIEGSRPRHNRYKILKIEGSWDSWKIREKIGLNQVFIASIDGKLRKAVLNRFESHCDCCGSWDELEFLDSKR